MSFAADVDSCLLVAERPALEAAAKSANFVFSRLSLRAALALATAGADGETPRQMLSFLGSPTVDHLNDAAAHLMAPVLGGGRRDEAQACVSFVNGSSPFLAVAADVYGAVVKSVDFRNNPTEEAKEINAWVHEETNGLIKDLIPLHAVCLLTRVILANALYFKLMWADKFDPGQTREARFHLLDKSSTVQVPFMVSRKEQFVSSFKGFKVLKLPYHKRPDHGRFCMLIVLPDEVDGLADVMHKVASVPNFLENHTPRQRIEVRNFMVPKFRIEYEFEASEVMVHLGVTDPFGKGKRPADFTRMASNLAAPADGLFISSVHHKAVIEVDEEGTVVAAATAIVIQLFSYSLPADFVADHPFVFAIVDEGSGVVLFLGHVLIPYRLYLVQSCYCSCIIINAEWLGFSITFLL